MIKIHLYNRQIQNHNLYGIYTWKLKHCICKNVQEKFEYTTWTFLRLDRYYSLGRFMKPQCAEGYSYLLGCFHVCDFIASPRRPLSFSIDPWLVGTKLQGDWEISGLQLCPWSPVLRNYVSVSLIYHLSFPEWLCCERVSIVRTLKLHLIVSLSLTWFDLEGLMLSIAFPERARKKY